MPTTANRNDSRLGYDVGCQKHLSVDEFIWIDDETVVGS